jgi:hypothetical protein
VAASLSGHAGTGVNYVARDPFTGRLWALLGHGHWGAKLSISDDEWRDLARQRRAGQVPRGRALHRAGHVRGRVVDFGVGWRIVTRKATLAKLWTSPSAAGAIWIGTIPGGLFESRDGGASFELNRPLWNHESRGGDLFNGEGPARPSGSARRPPKAASSRPASTRSWSTRAIPRAC